MALFHEKLFVILFRMIRWQNLRLLHEIGMRERVCPAELQRLFTPRRSELRDFLRGLP